MNDDLISRSALLKDIENYCGDYLKHGDDAFDKTAVRMVIKAAPAVDAVEVVRCKDCQWYQIRKWDDGKPEYDCRKTKGLLDVRPEDFCSYGERRGKYDR